jgi:hypothetical protein
MASIDWDLARVEDTSLVEVVIDTDVPARIRLESNLAPVWPPRRQGRPMAEWDGRQYETVVSPDSAHRLGYASPADPVEPPIDVLDETALEGTQHAPSAPTDSKQWHDDVDADQLVRALGDARPPRDVVPVPRLSKGVSAEEYVTPGEDVHDIPSGEDVHGVHSDKSFSGAIDSDDTGVVAEYPSAPPSVSDISAVERWIGAIEDRVRRVEQLQQEGNPPDARHVVEGVDGIDTVRQLREQVVSDRRDVSRVSDRIDALEANLAAVAGPAAPQERI